MITAEIKSRGYSFSRGRDPLFVFRGPLCFVFESRRLPNVVELSGSDGDKVISLFGPLCEARPTDLVSSVRWLREGSVSDFERESANNGIRGLDYERIEPKTIRQKLSSKAHQLQSFRAQMQSC